MRDAGRPSLPRVAVTIEVRLPIPWLDLDSPSPVAIGLSARRRAATVRTDDLQRDRITCNPKPRSRRAHARPRGNADEHLDMMLLPLHILAGLLALTSGAVAMTATKGGKLHRKSGMIFVIAMLVMTSSAVLMAAFFSPNRVNVMVGVLTFYLVCTGLLTMRRPVESARGLITGFMLLALTGSAYAFSLGFEALNGAGGKVDGIPPQPFFMFGVVGLLGGLLDARMLWAGNIQGAHRLARHLWRMGFAMWIATASFFLGQADEFPEPLRNVALLSIPVLLVLLFMLYWLVRVLLKRRNAVTVQVQ